jgi:hypothetical protein
MEVLWWMWKCILDVVFFFILNGTLHGLYLCVSMRRFNKEKQINTHTQRVHMQCSVLGWVHESHKMAKKKMAKKMPNKNTKKSLKQTLKQTLQNYRTGLEYTKTITIYIIMRRFSYTLCNFVLLLSLSLLVVVTFTCADDSSRTPEERAAASLARQGTPGYGAPR